MTISFKHHCQPAGTDPPAECSAEFTVNGLAGNQKFQAAGPVTLEAVDQTTNLYKWEVISSPPDCDNLLTRITPYSATLRLPRPGAYVVELTVCKEDCSARTRYILWVVTPNLMYCIPATNEPLRFDGKEEWAGDLARVIVDVDRNLPTNNEKDALHGFNEDYPPSTENPYATREDLIDRPGPPGRQLTDDEIDAIKAAEDPNKRNPFITQSALPPPELTKDQKEAIEAAEDPNKCNPFITESALPEGFLDGPDGPFVTQVEWAKTAPTEEQKKAMDGANEPGEENPFATHDDLPSLDDYVTRPEWLARAPAVNEKQALQGLNPDTHSPSDENRYVTKDDLSPVVIDPEADFVTREEWLARAPEVNEKQALAGRKEHEPGTSNPYITEKDLSPVVLDPEADFVTRLEWLARAPEVNEKQALAGRGVYESNGENPYLTEKDVSPIVIDPEADFVTRPEWLARAPEVNEKQALQGINPDTHPPSDENRYITKNDLSPVVIDPEADFVTRPEWLERAPAVSEKQALQGINPEIHPPSDENRYVTKNDLSPVVIDPEADFVTREEWLARAPEVNEKQALAGRGVYEPNGENPYLTEKDVSPIVIDPETNFVTRPEWLERAPELNEKRALQGLNPDTHPPSDENRYVTKDDLSPVVIDPEADFVTREEWQKTAPSEDEKAALQGVNPDHQPNAGNRYVTEDDLPDGLIDGPDGPYVTREEWEKTAPSECQKEAMDGANGPGAANPFATQDDLPNPDAYVTRPEWLERAPAVNEKQALAGRGEHEPGTTNPYITEQDLSPVVLNPKADFVTRSEWLERAPTTRQKSALNRANNPHADNPFATLADLRPIGEGGPQIVAAGMVDLSATTPDGMFGGLRVVRNGDGWGMATLSFDGYALSKQQNYVIKALPVNAGVRRQKFNEMIVVQFVEFQEDGFVLQMSQPFVHGDGRAALGPCMVEVTELMAEGPAPARVVASGLKIEDQEAELMAEAPSPSLPNLADAIEDYYNAFIAAGQYAEAWPMLSDGFKAATGLTTLEEYRQMWEQSGPAILLGFEEVELTENEATLILDLDYRQSGPIRQTCHFVRDEQEGHPRFGYWLFERQEPYHNSDLLSYRPTKTTPH